MRVLSLDFSRYRVNFEGFPLLNFVIKVMIETLKRSIAGFNRFGCHAPRPAHQGLDLNLELAGDSSKY